MASINKATERKMNGSRSEIFSTECFLFVLFVFFFLQIVQQQQRWGGGEKKNRSISPPFAHVDLVRAHTCVFACLCIHKMGVGGGGGTGGFVG